MTRSFVCRGIPDVAFMNMRYRDGIDRPPGALLAGTGQAAADGDRRLAQDARLRRHEQRADPHLRLGRELPPPETFGEFRLCYRTGDIVSPKVDATEPLALEVADFCAAILDGTEPRSTAQIGLRSSHHRGGRPVERLSGARVAVDQLEPLTMASPRASERDVDLSRT